MIETFVPVVARTGRVQGRVYRAAVRLNYLPERLLSELPGEDFHLDVEFHFKRGATGDIDNLLKPTLDLIKGSLIRDDRQIKTLSASLQEYSTKEGVFIKLSPLDFKKAFEPPIIAEVPIVPAPVLEKKRRPKKRKKLTGIGRVRRWLRRKL